MEPRFDRIDSKLDSILDKVNAMSVDHSSRLTHLETTQKGIIALCVALVTSAFGALAKALHLV
jgi:hypothetical protein